MAPNPRRWLKDLTRTRTARQWAQQARNVGNLSQRRLRQLQNEAQVLRRDLDLFLTRAQARQEAEAGSADILDLPPGTDWRWRPRVLGARISPAGLAAPDSGTRLGDETGIWHDCPQRALILRQVPNRSATDLAAYGLQLETLGFGGSFLSISVDLPERALQGLTRSHVIRMDATLSVERPLSIYARLNVGHGPNTDEMLRHLGDLTPGAPQRCVIEFDLHYLDMNERRLEKIWLDLIFEAPQMNSTVLRDLFLSRHLRADI
ncbi:MAG TPA: DUF6478 family protein [Paracoccus sp. (in: a-proteobacteria)]|nr:DUF6478 family protein [Paracoccus sp. (in: a-proteobacteria)]